MNIEVTGILQLTIFTYALKECYVNYMLNTYICIYVSLINIYISYDDMLCYVNVTFYKTVVQFYNCQFVYCAFCRSVTMYPFILDIYILMHYAS